MSAWCALEHPTVGEHAVTLVLMHHVNASQRRLDGEGTPFRLAPDRAPAAPRRKRPLMPSPTAVTAATMPWAAAANRPLIASIGSASLNAFNRLQGCA